MYFGLQGPVLDMYFIQEIQARDLHLLQDRDLLVTYVTDGARNIYGCRRN